ncbi:AAA family ATPase [Kitasatospora sp. NBC_00374]|uniref:AAA family ATPase n=1 Tax=Kitasatospora sp. NBC_00374 TaxID=2975964 RepID=UPI003243C557
MTRPADPDTTPPAPRLRIVTDDDPAAPWPDEPDPWPDPWPTPGPPLTPVAPALPAADQAARPKTVWTATELMATRFPEPKWAVPGFFAEGVSLLAGPPKVGKSWLSLGLGLDVAAGRPVFGTVPVTAGPVLYLALEDTGRRLQNRMSKLLAHRPAPDGLTLMTECPPMPQGAQLLANWLGANPTARLVVIDVFAKVRGISAPGASAYDADYAAIGHIKAIADHFAVAVILVHHVRKMGSDDFLAEVSGTNGLAGAADATLVLKRSRGKADGVLHITGRDVDENEHALSFQPDTGSWLLLNGPASDHTIGDTRATILTHVRTHPGARPMDIAAATGLDVDLTRRTCSRMAEAGQLNRDTTGAYTAPAPPDTLPIP